MQRLAYLQNALDPLDIEGLNSFLKSQQGIDLLDADEDDLADILGGEVSLEEYERFVESFSKYETHAHDNGSRNLVNSHASTDPTECIKDKARDKGPFLNEETPLRTLIIAYLLSASFKDCSMIIKITQDSSSSEEEETQRKTLNAYLVDVDVKSIKRLARYAKLDRDLVESLLRYEESGGIISNCRI